MGFVNVNAPVSAVLIHQHCIFTEFSRVVFALSDPFRWENWSGHFLFYFEIFPLPPHCNQVKWKHLYLLALFRQLSSPQRAARLRYLSVSFHFGKLDLCFLPLAIFLLRTSLPWIPRDAFREFDQWSIPVADIVCKKALVHRLSLILELYFHHESVCLSHPDHASVCICMFHTS